MIKFDKAYIKLKFISQFQEELAVEGAPERHNTLLRRVLPAAKPAPFPGRWPTRILIFSGARRISQYYLGKRMARLSWQAIFNWSLKPWYLEFDRENVVMLACLTYEPYGVASNLAEEYYLTPPKLRGAYRYDWRPNLLSRVTPIRDRGGWRYRLADAAAETPAEPATPQWTGVAAGVPGHVAAPGIQYRVSYISTPPSQPSIPQDFWADLSTEIAEAQGS
jgi:hypothetical protein